MSVWLPLYQQRAARRSAIAHYLPVLFGLAACYPLGEIIELGTDIGESTVALLAAAELTGGHVWSADVNPLCQMRDTYARHDPGGLYGTWTFLKGESCSPPVLAAMPAWADVLFVDSSHLYDQTCDEIEHYLPRVRPGGVALFHDTDKPGTADRVREALDDTLPGFGLTWQQYPGDCGLGVVRIPPAES